METIINRNTRTDLNEITIYEKIKHLNKQDVLNETIVAANVLITDTNFDYTSFSLWSEALARYVLNPFIDDHPEQNTYMQDMLNYRQQVIQAIITKQKPNIIISYIQSFITEIIRLTIGMDLNDKIEYSPIIGFVSFGHCP